MKFSNESNWQGSLIAGGIVLLWMLCLSLGLNFELSFSNPFTYLIVFLQMHLFTGLFISAHDAMHGTVSPIRGLNDGLGQLATFLYAFFYLPELKKLHHLHHDEVVGEHDPDYHDGGFFAWYFNFFRNYVSWKNFLGYAIAFNILKLFFPVENLVLFWIVPALLSSFQLFYFGTYRPHRKEHHHLEHSAGSQKRNHFFAFWTCYFFGYHQEHHQHPGVPWWQMYKLK